MVELITKQSLKEKKAASMKGSTIKLLDQTSGHVALDNVMSVDSVDVVSSNSLGLVNNPELSAYELPINGRPSIASRIQKGSFSNTTPIDVADFIDATRLDVSRRKEAIPTVRQFIYNEISKPDAGRVVSVNDLFPYGIVFEENNGNGESVPQGSWDSGNVDTITNRIYGAGFKWTLAAALFNKIFDMQRLNDGVATGYNGKKDDLAISPIATASYGVAGTAKHTAASTIGSSGQEKTYNTYAKAIADMKKRTDPVTKRRLNVESGLVLLTNSIDAGQAADVINGQLNEPADAKNLRGLRQIKRIVAYDGDTIDVGLKSVVYAGIPDNVAFLILPTPYFSICQKRGLTQEVGGKNVDTLSLDSFAWYFAESQYNLQGITHYVQKIELPTYIA